MSQLKAELGYSFFDQLCPAGKPGQGARTESLEAN